MNIKFAAATLATSLFASGAAIAAPMYINVNAVDNTPIGGTDGRTADIYEWGVHFNAHSTFTDTTGNGALDVGDAATDIGYGTITYLGEDANGLRGAEKNEGSGVSHQLHFTYEMAGTVAIMDGNGGIASRYTSGEILVYLDDMDGNDTHVATFNVYDSNAELINALIYAQVSWAQPDVFFFADGSDWSAIQLPSTISVRIDTNLDRVTALSVAGTNPLQWTRNSHLDGSVQFSANQIPEPGVLALLGFGLLGAGVVRRSRKV